MKIRQRTTVIFSFLLLLAVAAAPGASIVYGQTGTQPPPTATTVPTLMAGGTGCAPNATKLVWYVGLGSGGNPEEIKAETAWLDKFNASQTEGCVQLQVVHNPDSYDTLHAMIAAGTPPDIVGPVGKLGRASFQGAWADVTPLAKAAKVDLTKYDPTLLDFIKDDNVQVGLPFAMFPAFIYYNKDLFDEAKLPYPPHKVGEQYMGKDWTIDTFDQLAEKLTVDKAGNDATNSSFDAKNITQYGFWSGYASFRHIMMWYGAYLPFATGSTDAVIPPSWRTASQWYYDAIWKNHFHPTGDAMNSDLLAKGDPFSSGNVAMTWSHTWYTCCFDAVKTHWDIAVVPTYNGKTIAGMHGDTFAIPKASKNTQVAFDVLYKMVTDKDLGAVYGGIPGDPALRDGFFATMNTKVGTNKIDWQVALDMLKYPDLPNHEAWMPNLTKSQAVLDNFKTKMETTPGLDINKELDQVQKDLDAAFKAAQ